MRTKYGAEILLITVTFILLGMGIVMIYSSSAVYAQEKFGNPSYFLWKHVAWIFIGLCFFMLFSFYNHKKLREWIKPLLVLSFLLLLVVYFFGREVGGARRWLKIAGMSLQPSELVKFVLILFAADYCDRKKSKMLNFSRGLLPLLTVIAVFCGLIFIQPDLGTPVLIAATCLTMIFIGGARWRHLFALACVGVSIIFVGILSQPYRRARFLSYLNPWQDAAGSGYQLVQSYLALGSGGLIGLGPGDSRAKLLYLPEPHTDFVFPVFAEEYGLMGSWTLLVLFGLFAWAGFRISKYAPSLFSCLLSSGVTLMIVFQAIFNIAVVTGLLPTKGLPLPFISFGGSALVMTLSGVGILLNISRWSKKHQTFSLRGRDAE